MSHSPYPNAYAQVYQAQSPFQQPVYPSTGTPQFSNSYQDPYPQRAPSRNAYHTPSNSVPQDFANAGFYQQPEQTTQYGRVDSVAGPSGQHGAFSGPSTPSHNSPPRRPLPTPQARPGSHPTFDYRPLPAASNDPRPSPSAPPASFHRPSWSASNVASSPSAFSARSADSHAPPTPGALSQSGARGSHISRPLPTPTSRTTRSVDLTRSASPLKDVVNGYRSSHPGPSFSPQRKRSLPTVPGQGSDQDHPEDQYSHPETPGGSGLHRNGTGIRPLPPSPIQTQIAQPPPPRQPWATASRMNGSESSVPPTPPKSSSGFSAHSRRVIPSALPPPTGALPQRPDLNRNESSSSAYGPLNTQSHRHVLPDPTRDSPISSESEDMYENALLQRPPQMAAHAVPEPTTPTYASRGFPTRSMTDDQQRPPEREPASTNSSPFKGRPRRQSLVSRIAELSLNGSTPDLLLNKAAPVANSSPPKREHPMPAMGRSSTQPNQPRWPAELPPLPRGPQVQSEPGERHPRSRQASPTRQQPPQHPGIAFPSDPQSSRQQPRDTSPSRFPPPPQHPSSPTRSRFPNTQQPQSRDTSPTRNPSHAQPLPPLPPRSNPTSPVRGRFPQQAPIRNPILPAPQAQRVIPDLDDAPPPSLRRSPSPARPSKFSTPAYHSPNGLPNIRTQDVQKSPLTGNVFSPPSAVTPTSAGSGFSLSQFPVPPQTYGRPAFTRSSGQGTRSREVSPARNGMPGISITNSSNGWGAGPSINVSGPGQGLPKISLPGMNDDDDDTVQLPSISIGGLDDNTPQISISDGSAPKQGRVQNPVHPLPSVRSKGGLYCGGCGGPILGRSVNTMGANWHPGCFRCAACDQLLENLAMFEHEGRIYCSLDYYEKFAPRCYHCQTAIADQDFITLSQTEGLGERTYHTQHFFCAECGDPFLPPSDTARNFSGDGTFDGGAGEGFTVYNGHPYCERCHVRLRMPKCKKCKKPLRQDQDVLEVLGGKWCPECFVCKGCDGPFMNGRFFLRDEKPFCQRCFEIIIKSEL